MWEGSVLRMAARTCRFWLYYKKPKPVYGEQKRGLHSAHRPSKEQALTVHPKTAKGVNTYRLRF